MGWFGVSNSANRSNNLESMAIDLNNTRFLKNTTGQMLAATDYQLGRANALAGVVGSQPSTKLYSRNNVSSTAGELATELRFAIQDGQRFRAAISELNSEITEGTEIVETLLSQYHQPRGQRTLRFGPQNVPPSGKEIAVVSDQVANTCISKVEKFSQIHQSSMARSFGIIEKADGLVTGQVNSEQRPESYLRQLLNS